MGGYAKVDCAFRSTNRRTHVLAIKQTMAPRIDTSAERNLHRVGIMLIFYLGLAHMNIRQR